jgi:hypothetical protein
MSQPEPSGDWPPGFGFDSRYSPATPPAFAAGPPGPPGPPDAGSRLARRRRRFAVFTVLLVCALAGLAFAAVGIAHGLLPRQFTASQRRQISDWEMERRWRALPAGKTFPASVSYTVPATDLNSGGGLTLTAQRLAISPAASCAGSFDSAASSILARHGCTTVLRATYLDASGSMVATIAVAVLPGTSAAAAVYAVLPATGAGSPGPALSYPVPGTAAASFGDAQRQLSSGITAGPYVILSTAGFADDRGEHVSADPYVSGEMDSLANGLVTSVQNNLARQPPVPVCPGAPGC